MCRHRRQPVPASWRSMPFWVASARKAVGLSTKVRRPTRKSCCWSTAQPRITPGWKSVSTQLMIHLWCKLSPRKLTSRRTAQNSQVDGGLRMESITQSTGHTRFSREKVVLLNINQEQNKKDYYTWFKIQLIQAHKSSTGQLEIFIWFDIKFLSPKSRCQLCVDPDAFDPNLMWHCVDKKESILDMTSLAFENPRLNQRTYFLFMYGNTRV